MKNNFYKFYSPLLPDVRKLKNGAQLVSGLTASVGIYAIVAPKTTAFYWLVGLGITLFLTALSILIIEGGLRKLAPFAVRQLVWLNFENVWWRIMYAPILGITIALLSATTALSWFASPEIVEQVAPAADTVNVAQVATGYDARHAAIVSSYEKQRNSIKTAIQDEKTTIADKYTTRAKKYRKRAKNATEGREWLQHLASKADNRKTAALAELTTKQTAQIAEVNKAEQTALAALSMERSQMVGAALSANTNAVVKMQNNVNLWGRFLAWIAVGAGLLFVLCVVLEEVFKRGASETPPDHLPAGAVVVPVSNSQTAIRKQYTETVETPPGTKAKQETQQAETYRECANKCRVYWRRYMAQPETETGKANKIKSQLYAAKLESLGYKVTQDASDKNKVNIKPIS